MGYISVRNVHKEFMKDGEPLTILENTAKNFAFFGLLC